MARVLITGSADGLGRHTAQRLAAGGHEVVLHARSEERLADARAAVPGAHGGLAGDLALLAATERLAADADALGPFDCVVHNAGLYVDRERQLTPDGLPRVLQVNVLAPYVLTTRMAAPGRLIYLSSGLHRSGTDDLSDLTWERRRWRGMQAYGDSKLCDVLLAFAFARRLPGTASAAVDPGWVRTKMGGTSAPRDLDEGTATQAWLATRADPAAIDGRYFADEREEEPHPAARDGALQDELLRRCAELTGVDAI
jgi:NAD(P)-dependent dehydrogenase (short-subunit alcohol dehydrogenase family)